MEIEEKDNDDKSRQLNSILEKTYYNVETHPSESLDWFNVLIAQTIDPVSYTHLDVYKRQKLDSSSQKRIVVFVARKEMAHKLRIILGLLGMQVGELHGSLTQDQRLQSVSKFKSLEVPVLICTDLASRGLDIPKIEVVINYDMPKTYEIYLHRVGRTARAGREGRSVTFVGESAQDRSIVRNAVRSVEENKASGKALSRNVDLSLIHI